MDFFNLVPITLLILLIGHYFITITNVIKNWIYIRYMRPLKIEDARIASEEQQQDEEEALDKVKLVGCGGDIGKYNGLLDGKAMNPVIYNERDADGAEAFIDYSRNNQSDEDEDYNFGLNGNSYSGPDYNFNDGDW
jgi:hypothetical protein